MAHFRDSAQHKLWQSCESNNAAIFSTLNLHNFLQANQSGQQNGLQAKLVNHVATTWIALTSVKTSWQIQVPHSSIVIQFEESGLPDGRTKWVVTTWLQPVVDHDDQVLTKICTSNLRIFWRISKFLSFFTLVNFFVIIDRTLPRIDLRVFKPLPNPFPPGQL